LHERGWLLRYWTGIPTHASHARWIPRRAWNRAIRYAPVPLPVDRVTWNPVAPVLNRLARRVLSPEAARRMEMAAYGLFDRRVARALPRAGGDVFVGYETACLASFRAARRLGMKAVLDAASLHHTAQDRLQAPAVSRALHARICRMKDAEIELADVVLTVSELARRTYVDAGVPEEKVHAVGLGADLEIFSPGTGPRHPGFEFVYAGSVARHKGIDVLLDAYARAAAGHADARLSIIGGTGDAMALLDPPPAGVAYDGPATQERLAARLRAADCLVLASRFDSYGMVVAEALACGTPVIVSDQVGAAAAVEDNVNGWVVPAGDAGALAGRMAWCLTHRDAVRAMRGAAASSATRLSWNVYRERVAQVLLTACA
jgi:glycosyltransferase involved in cell wall biosynthesis